MVNFVIFLIFAGIIGVLWVGARDVQNGTTSAGELIQFLIYAIMVGGSVAALSEIWGELQRAAGATERLAELLNARDCIIDPVKPKILPNINGKIQFNNVEFSYPSRPKGAQKSDFEYFYNFRVGFLMPVVSTRPHMDG